MNETRGASSSICEGETIAGTAIKPVSSAPVPPKQSHSEEAVVGHRRATLGPDQPDQLYKLVACHAQEHCKGLGKGKTARR
jgi:hypothetical protein